MESLNNFMDHILYEIFKTILSISSKNMRHLLIILQIYVNKMENRITFKINKEYYLELLRPETMKLLGSTTSKINKDKNRENVLI